MSKKTQFKLSYRGQIIFADISPCSWMYHGYGLQFKLSLKEQGFNAESVFIKDRLECCDIPLDVILPHAKKLAIEYIQKNGTTKLQEAIDNYQISLDKFQKEFEADNAKEEARTKERHAKNKAEGFGFYFSAWIHPIHGDDYGIEAYLKEPNERIIANLLKKSTIKTDYTITAL